MYLSYKMTWIFRKVFTAFRLGIEKLLFSVCPFLPLFLSFPFLLIRLNSFRAVLGSQQNWGEGTEISHIFSVPTHTQPPSLSTSSPEWGHLLQLINPPWHIIIPQSPLWLMVNIMVHSLCCPFCGFRHMHNDIYPSLWYFFFSLQHWTLIGNSCSICLRPKCKLFSFLLFSLQAISLSF